MKRFWIILLAMAMALVIALPAATAKPKPKPPKPEPNAPALFDVRFEFSGSEAGFSSTTGCMTDEEGNIITSITMEEGGPSGLLAVGVPMLDVKLPNLEWYRYYPYFAHVDDVPENFNPNIYPLLLESEDPHGVFGCHGGGVRVVVTEGEDGKELDSTEQYSGTLGLIVSHGSVDLTWFPDTYLEWVVTEPKNPNQPPRVVASDMENFKYRGDGLEWSGDWNQAYMSTGLVTGEINVEHFSPGDYTLLEGNPVYVEFTMTITPKS